MAPISDFAKSSCFTYLTSPILAATRGGQAYEVPLHRLPFSNNKTQNNSTSDIRKTILGVTTKPHTYVPDLATKWYACHLKQMQKIHQQELARQEKERENENLHKQLLYKQKEDYFCCNEADIDGCERPTGGYEWNSKNRNLQRDRNHIKHSSSDYEELMRIHEQTQNKKFSSQRVALGSICNRNRIKPSLSDYEELMRIHKQSQNKKCSSQQVALEPTCNMRRSKLPPKEQKKLTKLGSLKKNNVITNSCPKKESFDDLVCRSRANINSRKIEAKKCLRAHSTLLAKKSKVPNKVHNKSIYTDQVQNASPKNINVCCSKNPKKAIINSTSNQRSSNNYSSYFEEDRESILTIVPQSYQNVANSRVPNKKG